VGVRVIFLVEGSELMEGLGGDKVCLVVSLVQRGPWVDDWKRGELLLFVGVCLV